MQCKITLTAAQVDEISASLQLQAVAHRNLAENIIAQFNSRIAEENEASTQSESDPV